MCEILAVSWPEPRPFSDLELMALELERLGIAGFGWGVAWTAEGGICSVHKHTGSFADDYKGRHRLEEVSSSRFLIHLRRPSRLSTIDMADTQPFVDDEGRFAFSHNGLLHRHEEYRGQYTAHLRGAGDSEVAFQMFRDLVASDRSPADALGEVHKALEGQANFVYLAADAPTVIYSSHRENPVWTFRFKDGHFAATALHSTDNSVFDLVFPDATDRKVIGPTPAEL